MTNGQQRAIEDALPEPVVPGHSQGGNGNGRTVERRLSALETRLRYLATKEDIAEVKALISQREASMQRWLIGILVSALVALSLSVVRVLT